MRTSRFVAPPRRPGAPQPAPPTRADRVAAAFCALTLCCAAAPARAETYATRGQCAGHPRVALAVPKGWCVGLVADASVGLNMPRRLLEVAPGRFWVVDMGSWEPQRGRLLELRPDEPPDSPGRWRTLASGLDRPHGLARGPDGRVYVGEAGTVWRTAVTGPAGGAIERENVVESLPADGAHPLKELAFDGRRLFINLGSATDACRDDNQQQPLPCPELKGSRPRASVLVTTLEGPDFKPTPLQAFATGLRNSLGLAVVPHAVATGLPTGVQLPARVWQTENSIDYSDIALPADELNELLPGAHYGWPACVTNAQGKSVAAIGYEGRVRCNTPTQRRATQALPAHVAPLQLLAVPAAAKDETATPWSGKLLSVWHGHRSLGHRIVAWPLGADGAPNGPRENIVSGWNRLPGVRPLGNPAGATVDHQGRLWVVEDRNRTVLVVAPENE